MPKKPAPTPSKQDPAQQPIKGLLLNIDDLPGIDTTEKMAYLYLVKGYSQPEISTVFNCSPQNVSLHICKFKANPEIKKRLVSVWEKDISIDMRRKAAQINESIDPAKMVEGSKAMSLAVLIDKSRLIDGESTENIAYADFTRELRDIEQEEAALAARLE
jgi:hypothetical protein